MAPTRGTKAHYDRALADPANIAMERGYAFAGELVNYFAPLELQSMRLLFLENGTLVLRFVSSAPPSFASLTAFPYRGYNVGCGSS